jgi:Family of unknown function (DUF5317)
VCWTNVRPGPLCAWKCAGRVAEKGVTAPSAPKLTLALAFLLLLLTVPAAGGRLGALEEVRLRWVWLVALAFAIQVLLVTVVPEGDTTVHRVAHVMTYGLAGACVVANLKAVRFVWVVALGGLLNFIAIAANGGVMPASRGALETAGLEVRSGSFANSDAVDGAHVSFLGDVFAIPAGWPGANVFSVGDALMLLGALLVLHAATGSRLFAARRTAPPRARGSRAAPQR